jgi:uncharacterized protein YndB with AHSA1/START domain
MKNEYLGRWHIVEMERWEQDFVDQVVPGYILIAEHDVGEFQFGTLCGSMECHIEPYEDSERLTFEWESDDEMDPLNGRGWATINEKGQLEGRFYFHDGDDSGFIAERNA